MRKLMMLATILALVAALSVSPALAQGNHSHDRFNNGLFNNDAGVDLSSDQEAQSGDVQLNNRVTNTGDYAMQCTPALQFGQTGNLNNAPAFLQYASEADDFQPGGIDFTIEPTVDTSCDQSVQQSSAASS